MRMPTQVSAVKGVRKSKKPEASEMSFFSRMLIPVCMNGLVIPTAFSRAAVRVSGAIARSASCRGLKKYGALNVFHKYTFTYFTCISCKSLMPAWWLRLKLLNTLLPLDTSRYQSTHPSHHLSNHPIPVPTVILPAICTVFHQLHSVLEAQLLGYFRQQVHAKAFQLSALGNCVRFLLQ